MHDPERDQANYFAHLDSQLVSSGRQVQIGDTLGMVGNTGNARTTPPHLHFGIYQQGSKDPIYYLRSLKQAVKLPPYDSNLQSKVFRVAVRQAKLLTGPDQQQPVLAQLPKATYVSILGQSGDWYRLGLPDQTEGYMHKKAVQVAEKGQQLTLRQRLPLLSKAQIHAVPVMYLDSASSVEVLASFNDFKYVQTQQKQKGWLQPYL